MSTQKFYAITMSLVMAVVFMTGIALNSSVRADDETEVSKVPAVSHVKVQTSMGDFVVALEPEKAPVTVANFVTYMESGHFDRTIFHRVVPGFVIQGGGYSRYFTERRTREEIIYEGDNGLKNVRGSIAMARTSDPNSATAQWFINLRDNEALDHSIGEYGPIAGYAVFGNVVSGMEIVDAIGSVATGEGGPFEAEVPIEQIVIERVDAVEWSEKPPSD